jgi:photosystem II stability/assembly factor-like uncharacterized protein
MPRRCRVVLLTAALALILLSTVGVGSASAHSPHDVVREIEVSPDYERDQTVFALVREHLIKSEDGGTTWRRLVRGLDNRGQLNSLEVSPQDGNVLYVSARGDGVYRSADGGLSWTPATGDLAARNVVRLALSPQSPDRLVAIVQRQGVRVAFSTSDGGQRWTEVPGSEQIDTLTFAPDDLGLLVGGWLDGTVRQSRDGGSSWDELARIGGSAGITAIAVAPADGDERTIAVATRTAGLHLSSDGGATFERSGPDAESIMGVALSESFGSDGDLWVTERSTGAYASADGGATWVESQEGLTTNEQADLLDAPQFTEIQVASGAAAGQPRLFLAGFDGLFRSTDGRSWEEVETQLSSNIASLALSPAYADDQTVAVATYMNGAWLSVDGARTWEAINNGIGYRNMWIRAEDYVTRLTSIDVSPSFGDDNTLYAGQRGYVHTSDSAGDQWTAETPEGLVVEGEHPPDYTLWTFSPTFDDDQTIVLGTDGGKVFRSTDGGVEFAKVGQINSPITALVTTRGKDDTVVVAGTENGIRRSADMGESWSEAELGDVEVVDLAISRNFGDGGRAFAATDAGLFVSTDDTGEWTLVTIGGLRPLSTIEAVAVSPAFESDGTVLVSVRGRGLYRSVDRGETFTPIAQGLLEDNLVIGSWYHSTTPALMFSPDYERDRTVFGMAETTLLKSTDGGDTWARLELPVYTHDLGNGTAPDNLLPDASLSAPHLETDKPDRGFDTPLGRLSARRVAAAGIGALLVFGVLTASRRRLATVGPALASPWTHLAVSVAAFFVALAMLAA